MTTLMIKKKEYTDLVRRQKKVEEELTVIKRTLLQESERNIRPVTLRRWDRISHDLDEGKGHSFSSKKEMRAWFTFKEL